MSKSVLSPFVVLLLIVFIGCTRYEMVNAPAVDKPSELGAGSNPGISVTPASPGQCLAGGVVYEIFSDENRNGSREASEPISSQQIVCNGVNGTNGSDGANGNDGNDGNDGANGHSLVFQTLAAPAEVCAAGGSTIIMALDVTDTGQYDVDLPNQQSMTLCNGKNGADGANGEDGANAPIPSYSPAAAIQPCGSSAYGEVLLRLQNGQVLASLSNDTGGTMTRLAFIPDGSYYTTDSRTCQFSLSTSGATRSISWFGEVQQSWTVQ